MLVVLVLIGAFIYFFWKKWKSKKNSSIKSKILNEKINEIKKSKNSENDFKNRKSSKLFQSVENPPDIISINPPLNKYEESIDKYICSFDKCPNKEKGIKCHKCSRCQLVRYCSSGCQRAHWSEHKSKCLASNKKND